jgi:hypothetical protein
MILLLCVFVLATTPGSSIEFLGEPFTVIRSINNTMYSSSRILVKCSGSDGREAQEVAQISGTDGVNRTATFKCRVPTLRYLQTLIGYVPAQTRVIVSQTCSQFSKGVSTADNATTRRGYDAHPDAFVTHVRASGTRISHDRMKSTNGRRGFLDKVVGFFTSSKSSTAGTQLQAQMNQMHQSLGKTNDDLARMLKISLDLEKDTQDEFDTVGKQFLLFAESEKEQLELIEKGKKYALETTKVIKDINQRTEAAFKATDETLRTLSTQQSIVSMNLANLAGNTTAEIQVLHETLSNVTRDTNEAIYSLRSTVVKWNKESVDQRIQTARALSRLSVAVRDARTERQFRNDAAILMNADATTMQQENIPYFVFADVRPVGRDNDAARVAINVETIHVTSVGSGVPQRSINVPVVSTSAVMYTFRVISNREFLSQITSSGLTWDALLAYLGDGCSEECQYNSTNEDNIATCVQSCNLYMEVHHHHCTLKDIADANTNPQDWQTFNGINISYCVSGSYGSQESVSAGYVFDFSTWMDIRLEVCTGGGQGATTAIMTEVGKKLYKVTSPSVETCEMGVSYAASQSESSFDFIFVYIVEQMASLYETTLSDLDLIVHGRLPSGVTTIRSDLATTADGGIGRCMWNSVVVVSSEPWLPVYMYTLTSTSGGIDVDLTVDGNKIEDPLRNDISGLSDLTLGLSEMYPIRFVNVGSADSDDIYDIPPTELTTGQARTREGTALYMMMSEEPDMSDTSESNPVSAWESEHNEQFNHNAASVSAERDRVTATLDFSTGKFDCNRDQGTSTPQRGSSEPSMCDRIADGGWDLKQPVGGQTYLELQPLASSFVLTVEIPSGKLILQGSTACPSLSSIDPVYGGGVRLSLLNKQTASVDVSINSVAGCNMTRLTSIPGLGTSILLLDPCVKYVQIRTELEVCYAALNLTSVASESLEDVGTFSGAVDSSYVRSAVSTITDDLVIASTSVVVDTNSIVSELVDSLLKVIIEGSNITIQERDLEHLFNLSASLATNAAVAVNNSIEISTRPGYVKANTTALDTTLFELVDQMDQYTEKAVKRIENLKKLNAESVARRQSMSTKLDDLKDSQEKFLQSFGGFSASLGGFMETMVITMMNDGSSLDLEKITNIFGAMGGAAEGIGKGFGEAFEGIGKGIGDVIDSAGDLAQKALDAAIGAAKDLLSIPFGILGSTLMYVTLAITVVNTIGLAVVCCCPSALSAAKSSIGSAAVQAVAGKTVANGFFKSEVARQAYIDKYAKPKQWDPDETPVAIAVEDTAPSAPLVPSGLRIPSGLRVPVAIPVGTILTKNKGKDSPSNEGEDPPSNEGEDSPSNEGEDSSSNEGEETDRLLSVDNKKSTGSTITNSGFSTNVG